MPAMTKEQVLEALSSIKDADSGRSLVDAGVVAKVSACDGWINVILSEQIPGAGREEIEGICRQSIEHIAGQLGASIERVTFEYGPSGPPPAHPNRPPRVETTVETRATVDQPRDIPLKQASSSKTTSQGQAQAGEASLPNVKHCIAVGAGKGGVGKSTVSLNLAVALAKCGHSVGLLDGDIYGPSVPTLLGLGSSDTVVHEGMLQPFYTHGIKAMTIGKLVDPEKPLIWRGPMAHGAFKQLVEQTQWGGLDYLIIDLPPGTGDVPLTMAQMLALSGAIIVCTPQKVAQDDAVRAARMFQQLNIDVLGVVENMSYFIGDDGKEYDLFGRGGAEQMAQRLGLPFLASIPISMDLRANSDNGDPSANFEGDERLRDALIVLAKRVEDEVALAKMRSKIHGGPSLTVS